MHFAEIGSISSGTHRTEDLLIAFGRELDRLLKKQPRSVRRAPYRKLVREAARIDPDTEDAGDLVNQLFDTLGEFAPPYCHFGAHPDDGADFGFWPSIDSLEEAVRDGEVLKVNGTEDIPTDYRGEVMVVSDHGNVDFGAANRGKFKSIWAIV